MAGGVARGGRAGCLVASRARLGCTARKSHVAGLRWGRGPVRDGAALQVEVGEQVGGNALG